MKFSAKTGWNLDGGPLSRLQVWQRETQKFSDEVMPRTFQPEDYMYAVCYIRIGRSARCNYVLTVGTLFWHTQIDGEEKVGVIGSWSANKKQLNVVNCDATGITWVLTSVYNCYSIAVHAGTQLCIVHQSPTELEVPNLKQSCALWCIPHPYSYQADYYWCTIPDNGDVYPNSPVIFVDKPLVYYCKIIVGRSEVTSISMRVKVNPSNCRVYDI